ncbi:lysophosphatidic acid receptor 5 [Hemicordylus capensis]|uniref:lysophosphatidic acid receptor 5 n=1 Tax=Hemicordylus capensis TaxID=884348 RepID=UPI00230335BB|nr:lysophosphatidic acid receptor 5 [Hemicordylus capensis]XP_053157800.1 lysophosphatidic acid receptor 5 [Hemicordylus capensis]
MTGMSAPNATLCKDHSASHRLHLIGYSLIFTAGLLLNVAALWIFLFYLRLKSVVRIYMLNLAASDLLFTISLPLRIYYYSVGKWPFGVILCQVSGSVFQINMYGSCLFLMCINLDRFVAIVHPLRWRHLRRPKVARLLCLVVWVLILVGSVPVAGVHQTTECFKENQTNESITLCFESFSDGLWQNGLFPLVILAEILGFLLPLTSVTYCSVRIFQKLCQAGGAQSLRQQKTIRMLVVNLVIFVICFVPYNIILAVYGLIKAHVIQTEPPTRDSVRQALVVTVLLASMNCTLDPLVYYFNTEGFRNTLKKLRRGQAWDSETGTLQTRVTQGKSYQAHAKPGAKCFPVQNLILSREDLPFASPKIFLNSPIEDSEI